MIPRTLFVLVCSLAGLLPGKAQIIESNSNREKIFVFEVKHIDEFIERFNNEQRSLIISYVKINFPGITIDKASLVTNLFNRQNKNWNKLEVDSFISHVTSAEPAVYLDFYSPEWYAEALCKFIYKGKPVDVTIVLKIQQDVNGGSKWMIMGAKSRDIAPAKNELNAPVRSQQLKFLNPMSHATNFMSLSIALQDKTNIRDYFDTAFINNAASKAFLQALLKNQLEYQFVNKITYHFLQVDGWIFTVNRFTRKSINSGWLISGLRRASQEDKHLYSDSLLHKQF